MFRAGLYARVSTNDQQTLPMQSRAMREYAARRGWTIAVQVREVGSGAAKREAREKLLEAARRREIDVVLVWRLDRWGRSVTDLLATLQELEHLGVGFVSLTEALDLTTPAGRAMAGLLAVFAEFEREILRERTRAGLAHARQNGKRLGRPATADSMRQKSGNCIAPASANPKSPAAFRSAAPRCAGFWDDAGSAPKWSWMLLQPHPLLWTAIENTRMIRFAYHGKDRIAEPHDHGILKGSVQLLSWQVAGRSSRPLPNWLLTKVDEITDLELLDQTFPGGRPTATGKHIKWDVLFIRVKPAKSQLHAVPKRKPG